jgi:hypothetical protein
VALCKADELARTGPLPALDEQARAERAARAKRLAPKYKNEMLAPE